MINYFILGYQGFDYFKEKFDNNKYPNTVLRIIDNGNQKISGHQYYKTKKNIDVLVVELNLLYSF